MSKKAKEKAEIYLSLFEKEFSPLKGKVIYVPNIENDSKRPFCYEEMITGSVYAVIEKSTGGYVRIFQNESEYKIISRSIEDIHTLLIAKKLDP